MKSVVGISFLGTAVAVRLGAFAGLDLAIEQIQKLNEGYKEDLSNHTTFAATYQEACRIRNANTADEIDNQMAIDSQATQAASEAAGLAHESEKALIKATEDLAKQKERGETSTAEFEAAKANFTAYQAENAPILEQLKSAKTYLVNAITGAAGESFVQKKKSLRKIKALVQQEPDFENELDDLESLDLSPLDESDAAASGKGGLKTLLDMVNDLYDNNVEMMQKKT